MRTNKFFMMLAFIGLSLTLIISGCKKDDDKDNTPEPVSKKPAIESKAEMIQVPEAMQQSTDPKAQEATLMVETMASLASYFVYFDPPANATQIGTKSTNESWKWTDGEYYYYYTYQQTSTKYTWEIKLGTDGETYYDFLLAEEALDGKSGNIRIYYDAFYYEGISTEDWYFDYSWEFDNSNNLTVDMYYYLGEEGYLRYYGKFMNNGSGELSYYIGQTMFYKMTWTATGSGQWYEYDLEGNLIAQGAW